MIEILLWVAVGLVIFMLLRKLMRGYFVRMIQRKVFEQEYSKVLNSAEFKVKGRDE